MLDPQERWLIAFRLLLLHLQFVLELLDKKGKLAILYIDARLLQESILVELVVLLLSLLQPRLKI